MDSTVLHPQVIPMLTLCMTMVVHLVSTVWWAAGISRRVEHIEKWITYHEHTAERLAALEERIENLTGSINRIELYLRQRQ